MCFAGRDDLYGGGFLSDEKGTETVEWAIMIGIIAVAAIATIVAIGGWVQTQFTTLNNGLGGAGS